VSRTASPFTPRTLLAVIVVGAGAFLLFLYALGAGWDGGSEQDGGAHAGARGLNGFAGLVRLLEAQGHEVSLSRSEARLDDESLLVLTPQAGSDPNELAQIIANRRYSGPTLLILPKWFVLPASMLPGSDAPEGWVMLGGADAPDLTSAIVGLEGETIAIAKSQRWHGAGETGSLPEPDTVMAFTAGLVMPMVTDDSGRVLAGYIADNGAYPVLAQAAGVPPLDPEGDVTDNDIWPVVIVAEPDLMNNYGLADQQRAGLAHAIVDAALEDYDLPVVFDLTASGISRSQNLLTLVFEPPFLAATLCLLLAALVIGWRAFRRFGPPVAEAPALAMGKKQLARNGGGLVERAKRLHLLGPPYAALITARMAETLGIREPDLAAREAAIGRVLAGRGLAADYAERAEALRRARHPNELLRAASALRSIERTVTP
jgi:hypothetical protein